MLGQWNFGFSWAAVEFSLLLKRDQLRSRMKVECDSGDLVQVVVLQLIICVTWGEHSVTQIQMEAHLVQS